MAEEKKNPSEYVKVKISYPDGFKDHPKWLKEGEVVKVSRKTAETYVAKGIGTIVEESN